MEATVVLFLVVMSLLGSLVTLAMVHDAQYVPFAPMSGNGRRVLALTYLVFGLVGLVAYFAGVCIELEFGKQIRVGLRTKTHRAGARFRRFWRTTWAAIN